MRKLTLLMAGLILCLPAIAQFDINAFVDSLTRELTEHFEASDLPGFAVALVTEEGAVYQKGFGLADKTEKTAYSELTVQNLGSVSKTVVGLALAKAIEEGKISLDTEINTLLPFPIQNPYFKDSPILVRHLANHTSGIRDTKHYGKTYILHPSFTETEGIHPGFLGFLRSHPQMALKDFLFHILSPEGDWYRKKHFHKTQPGHSKDYANLNAALMAYLIELATDIPFSYYTQTRIFDPLNMPHTSWQIEDSHQNLLATPYFPAGAQVPRYSLITYPDGGLYTNTNDLSHYLSEMIKAYAGHSNYLPSTYAKFMLPGDGDEDRAFWGMGEISRNIGHGGSDPGTQTDLQFNADRLVGRIILTNVNAEDNEILWEQYKGIHQILARYEEKIAQYRRAKP